MSLWARRGRVVTGAIVVLRSGPKTEQVLLYSTESRLSPAKEFVPD